MIIKGVKIPKSRKIRVYGKFGEYGRSKPARVWIALVPEGVEVLEDDTILHLRDAHGYTDEILAGEPGVMYK